MEEIQKRAEAEVKRRDAAWQTMIRDEWDAVNKRAEEYADLEGRVRSVQAAVEVRLNSPCLCKSAICVGKGSFYEAYGSMQARLFAN